MITIELRMCERTNVKAREDDSTEASPRLIRYSGISPESVTMTVWLGDPELLPTRSIARTTSMPEVTERTNTKKETRQKRQKQQTGLSQRQDSAEQ